MSNTSTQTSTSVGDNSPQENSPKGFPSMTASTTLRTDLQREIFADRDERIARLRAILDDHGQPDPALVSKLVKNYKNKSGGWSSMELDYVGHAEITRILIEIDPLWNWEPMAWEDGRPKITIVNGNAILWGRLTVLGKTILGVGSASADKNDLDKELVGDFLRNAAMRLGIALALWSKAEWDEHDTAPKPARIGAETTPAVDDITIDPVGWVQGEMKNATSLTALDAIAGLAKARLTPEQRDQVRPLYLQRKADLEA